MNWRELIHQYLIACAEDAREQLLAAGKSRQRKFIEKSGTTSLRERDAERMQSLALESEAPLDSPDGYKVVEERPDLIIVEVEPGPNGHPIVQTRFRLTQSNESWLLDDTFWKCHCSDGECSLCDGTGTCRICMGAGTWRTFWGLLRRKCMLCNGEGICRYCKGTRLCDHCKESDIPGWSSTTSELSMPSEAVNKTTRHNH